MTPIAPSFASEDQRAKTTSYNKSVLIHQRMSQHTENSILAITAYKTSKLKTKFVLIHQRMSQHTENSILAFNAYNT